MNGQKTTDFINIEEVLDALELKYQSWEEDRILPKPEDFETDIEELEFK